MPGKPWSFVLSFRPPPEGSSRNARRRQVSWLAALRSTPAFPEGSSGTRARARRSQLRGQPRLWTDVPTAFPLGSLEGNRRPGSHSGICRAGKSNLCGKTRRKSAVFATNRRIARAGGRHLQCFTLYACQTIRWPDRRLPRQSLACLPRQVLDLFAKPALAAFHFACFLILPFLLCGIGHCARGTTTAR